MTSVEIINNSIERKTWDELLCLSMNDILSIYQTYEWASLMQFCYDFKPHFIIVKDRNEPIGGLMYFKKPIFKYFYAYESFGGPLCTDGNRHDVVECILKQFKQDKNFTLYKLLRPNFNHDSEKFYQDYGFIKNPLHTILLSLNIDEAYLWKNITKNARNGVTKGERSGLLFKEAKLWEEWYKFFKLHYMHSIQKNIAPKPKRFFQEIYKKFYPINMVKLFVILSDGKIIAGMLFLLYRGTMTYYIGASDMNYSNYSPNDYLMWNSIRWGNKNGISVVDFGDTQPDPSSHVYGIHKFKDKWGGKLINKDIYISGKLYGVGRNLVLKSRSIQNMYEYLHKHQYI